MTESRPRRAPVGLAVLTAGAMLLTPVAALASPSTTLASSSDGGSGESQSVTAIDRDDLELVAETVMLEQHNEQRAAGSTRDGVRYDDVTTAGPLTGWTDVMTVARRWSDTFSNTDFRHNPDYGRQYGGWRSIGENIAYTTLGSASTPLTEQAVREAATSIMDMWWHSTGHRTNMMRDRWDHIGVGVDIAVMDHGGHELWVMYATANFRDHDGSELPGTSFALDGSLPPNETAAPAPQRPVAEARTTERTCSSGTSFADARGGLFEDEIGCMRQYDITQGLDGGRYAPGQALTIGQLAAFVTRTAGAGGIDTVATDVCPSNGGLFGEALDTAVALGAISVGDCRAPGDLATRSEMAVAVAAVLESGGLGVAEPTDWFHDDESTGAATQRAHNLLAQHGVVVGFGDGTFRGNSRVTRGQMARFLAAGLDALLNG